MKRKIGLLIYYFFHYGQRYLHSPLNILFKYLIAPSFFLYWRLIAKSIRRQRKNQEKPRLVWGATPIISNKYWSQAMRDMGYSSITIMEEYYGSINKREDFDIYYDTIHYKGFKRYLQTIALLFPKRMDRFLVLDEVIKNYDIIHSSFIGSFLGRTPYWNKEVNVMKRAGMKVVILPFGGDFYRYSRVLDKSWQHGLLANYPNNALSEEKIQEKITHYTQYADCIMAGFQFDGIGRWDVFPYAIYPLDCKLWQVKESYTINDGLNGVVKIIHTPNHRTIKGTEFIIQAVKELKEEGLQIELILLEKIQNNEVRNIMRTQADILVEQLIISYALSGIEGMASGLPVLANLDNEVYTRPFRRYSYLNECPIFSTSPETIKENLRILIKNPQLREKLGKTGREYAVKYHSFEAMQYIFTNIYEKIWHEKDVDLMNMFHPIMPDSYNNQSPKIMHPLVENKIPAALLATLNQ